MQSQLFYFLEKKRCYCKYLKDLLEKKYFDNSNKCRIFAKNFATKNFAVVII